MSTTSVIVFVICIATKLKYIFVNENEAEIKYQMKNAMNAALASN